MISNVIKKNSCEDEKIDNSLSELLLLTLNDVISPFFLIGHNGPIKSPVNFGGYEWFNMELRPLRVFLSYPVLILHFQRPKLAV